MKYQVGQKVKLNKNFPTEGLIMGQTVTITSYDAYNRSYRVSEYHNPISETYLDPNPDIFYTNKKGEKRRVLGQINDLIFLSKKDDFDRMGKAYTKKDLNKLGYK